MTQDDDLPIIRKIPPPPPKPEEVRFAPKLAAAPLDRPKPAPVDRALLARRARAEHLCLWMGCSRALCRRARHCLGPHADCVFEMEDVTAPILQAVVEAGSG